MKERDKENLVSLVNEIEMCIEAGVMLEKMFLIRKLKKIIKNINKADL